MGMVHREVRPQNILIDKDDQIKLFHMGLMKCVNGVEKSENGMVIFIFLYKFIQK